MERGKAHSSGDGNERLFGDIRLEQDEYTVDVFDSRISNPDAAYLTTHTCDTWEQVERYCWDYDSKSVV